MSLRIFSLIFAIFFIGAGIMGNMPDYVTDGNLFGIFEIGGLHNIAYLITGVLGLLAAGSTFFSKLYFQIIGLIYGVATVCGFVFAGDLYIMHVNLADNIVHLVTAVIALYLGYISSSSNRF